VYLQVSTEIALQRIQRRGRKFEKNIPRVYIEQLNEAYNHFFFHYQEAPLLVVNTNDMDFVRNKQDFRDLVRQILTMGQGVQYYNPARY
jgi:deoxyadenosine/deoxycytidine kinase